MACPSPNPGDSSISFPGKKSPLDVKPLNERQLRKAAFLTRTTRTKSKIKQDERKKPRPRLSVVLPDQYLPEEDSPKSARPDNANVTRKSVLISEVAVRTVSFLQALLVNEKESPGSLPKIRGEQFHHHDFQALTRKLGEMVEGPVDKYLYDLAVYLAQEMAKGGLQVCTSGSPIPITHENEFVVKDWLADKINVFHEPYRI